MAREPKRGNTFLIIVTAVSILILLFSCYKLIDNKKNETIYEESPEGEVVDLSMTVDSTVEQILDEVKAPMKLPDIVAHRGYCSIAPENTLEAFRRAVDVGADMIELDVQLTKDGYIVVFHDLDLSRITGNKKTISDYTYAELYNFDFGSYKSSYFTGMSSDMMKNNFAGTKISTLDEILQYAQSQNITINLELKDISTAKGISSAQKDTFAAMVVSRVYAYGLEDKVIFASFNYDYLAEIERLNSNNQTLYVTHEGGAANLINNYPADAYSIDLNGISKDDVEFFHNAGYPVYVWTANTKEMMLYALSLGSDGIITNYPGIASVLIHEEYEFIRNNYIGTMTAPVLYDYVDIASFSGYVLSDMTVINELEESDDDEEKHVKENLLGFSAYDLDNKANSIVFILNMNGELVNILDLGVTADVTGISYDNANDLLWIIAGDQYLYALDYKELNNGKHTFSYPIDKEDMEAENHTLDEYEFLEGAYKLDDIVGYNGSIASFIHYDDNKLYVGFGDNLLGVIDISVSEASEETDKDEDAADEEIGMELKKEQILSIPENISGVTLRYVYPEVDEDDAKKDGNKKDKIDEEVEPIIYLVMTGQVNNTDSSLIITEYKDGVQDYSNILLSEELKTVPPMALSPCIINDRLFLGFATSSRPYFNDSSVLNDQIWILDFE